jgi:XTP/dITP diphosphohydrolase
MDKEELAKSFLRLVEVVEELRVKCPWDKEQTYQTLRPLTIEECYELTDAVLAENKTEIKKELGDVLLHIIFYATIGKEDGDYNMNDVIASLTKKLIDRHPHIYGETIANDSEAVKQNWEKIKLKEGNKSVLSGVPPSLPSLIKAGRLQDKASSVGFDWDDKAQVWDKVQEEIQEFLTAPTPAEKEKEFGDILFSLVNYARFEGINPDNALEMTNQKFINRFKLMEIKINDEGKTMSDMTLKELDIYWEDAKNRLNQI